jgi:vacuolar-type H+-ATPase subunit I/STV1
VISAIWVATAPFSFGSVVAKGSILKLDHPQNSWRSIAVPENLMPSILPLILSVSFGFLLMATGFVRSWPLDSLL